MIHTDRLMNRRNKRFGIFSTRILVAFALVLAFLPFDPVDRPRSETPATILFWLSDNAVSSPWVMNFLRISLVVNGILWFFHRMLPWACWGTVVSLTALWSLRMENVTNGAHIFNVVNMLLIVHAMWYQFYHREIKGTDRLATDHCYPNWVFFLSVFFLGWFHSLAGITKVMHSGFGWGDGVSLQLWVHLFGWRDSPFAQIILYDTRLASIMQTGALFIELFSITCIFSRWLRYFVGLCLMSFYVGVLATFIDFGFHFNACLVLWFLSPIPDRFFQQND